MSSDVPFAAPRQGEVAARYFIYLKRAEDYCDIKNIALTDGVLYIFFDEMARKRRDRFLCAPFFIVIFRRFQRLLFIILVW